MNVSAWSIRNPIPAAMLFVMLTLAGLFSFQAMVLAQTVLVVPVVAALTRQSVEDAHGAGGEQGNAHGRSHFECAGILSDRCYTRRSVPLRAGYPAGPFLLPMPPWKTPRPS